MSRTHQRAFLPPDPDEATGKWRFGGEECDTRGEITDAVVEFLLNELDAIGPVYAPDGRVYRVRVSAFLVRR